MPQPVKISDTLIEEARAAAAAADRSMTGQIEHWVRLGRSVEAVLSPRELDALKRGPDSLAEAVAVESERRALRQTLRFALAVPGHRRLGTALRASGQTLYGTDPAFPGCLVRISPDGRRTPGHLVKRRFVPLGEGSTGRRSPDASA